MKIDERTGEVVRRPTLEKNKITRRHRVVNKRVERTKKIDSRFDTRRSPFKWKKLHPRNIGVVYLYALIWIVFSLWIPDTWTMWLTHRSVLNQNAILMVVAIGLLVPLAAGVFDLSIGGLLRITRKLFLGVQNCLCGVDFLACVFHRNAHFRGAHHIRKS
jgi:hypothetical protein